MDTSVDAHSSRAAKELRDRRRLGRLRKQAALTVAAAEAVQTRELVEMLDALGHDGPVQARAQVDDRADEGLAPTIRRERGHEGAVDLERIEGEALEVTEG